MRLRLLPMVVFAGSALLVLKTMSFFLEDQYPLGVVKGADAQQAADAGAQQPDTTPPPGVPFGQPVELGTSVSERAVLSSLGKRRDTLNSRESELDLREQMLNAAEAKLEKRIQELKALEQKIGAAVTKKNEEEAKQILDLVKIYESMKAKNAARIFDRLELDVLLRVVKKMQPRKMADVLANMSPDAAERLTIAIASGSTAVQKTQQPTALLPKIQGN